MDWGRRGVMEEPAISTVYKDKKCDKVSEIKEFLVDLSGHGSYPF